MTALRRWDTPTGLRHGDHVCWTFADAGELSAAILPFVGEGRLRGEQVMVTGESRPALLEALGPLPERDAMLASGQLQLRSTAEVYQSVRDLEPAAQTEVFRREVGDALERGHTGLRIAADMSELVDEDPQSRSRLHVYERSADTLIAALPLTGMCLYASSLGADALGPITVLHPIQHYGDREPLGYLSGRGPRLALHGEIDIGIVDDVSHALFDLACAAAGEVVLDLSDLEFCDVAGARMLSQTVRLLADAGVSLRLVRPRRLTGWCLELFDLPDEQEASA